MKIIYHIVQVSNSAGHEGMETMTCYCKTDLCNNRSFRKSNFKKWRKQTEALFKVKSIAFIITQIQLLNCH